MNAPDEIWYNDAAEYIRADLHQSALADRDREIARLTYELTDANEAVTIRQYALELRTAENERLQARLEAGPSVEQLRMASEHLANSGRMHVANEILETANRMESANAK